MIDLLTVFSKGGAVFWQNSLHPVTGNPVQRLVKDVLLEQKHGHDSYEFDKYTLKWTFHNDLGLVFVAVYLNLSQIINVSELLEKVKEKFVKEFKEEIQANLPPHAFQAFDSKYTKLVQRMEAEAFEKKMEATTSKPRSFEQTKKGKKILQSTDGGRKTNKQKKKEKKEREQQNQSGDKDDTDEPPEDAPEEQEAPPKEPAKSVSSPSSGGMSAAGKSKLEMLRKRGSRRGGGRGGGRGRGRRRTPKSPSGATFGAVGKPLSAQKEKDEEEEDIVLDYSKTQEEDVQQVAVDDLNFEFEDEESSESDDESEEKANATKKTGMWGLINNLTGMVTGKVLDEEDLEPVVDSFRQQLINKNVASEVAQQLCDSLATSLAGTKVGSFTTVKSTVKKALVDTLTRILTPKRSVDILQGVQRARSQGRPYTIVMVGVNGVGKSTSLAKLCAYFLKKGLKVSVAACDTFRSGAVEQLRTHSRRLGIDLFERGYSKDASAVAMDAVKEAKKKRHDVVMVDTAGRMQDNEPLMRALSKLINLNKPDLVLFVGEALVGNDAVDQLTKFNQCLADLSKDSTPRLIDGIVLTKFDTIDDKVGAAISMTYTTGKPIMFVGTGQNYGDLKQMNVKMLIRLLLK